jgi:hypothetical protein
MRHVLQRTKPNVLKSTGRITLVDLALHPQTLLSTPLRPSSISLQWLRHQRLWSNDLRLARFLFWTLLLRNAKRVQTLLQSASQLGKKRSYQPQRSRPVTHRHIANYVSIPPANVQGESARSQTRPPNQANQIGQTIRRIDSVSRVKRDQDTYLNPNERWKN